MRQIFSILSAEAGVGRYKTDCIIHTIRFPAPLTVFCHMRRKLFFEFFVTACRQPLPFRWAETLIAPNCESCGCPSMCSGFSANKREKKASIFFYKLLKLIVIHSFVCQTFLNFSFAVSIFHHTFGIAHKQVPLLSFILLPLVLICFIIV